MKHRRQAWTRSVPPRGPAQGPTPRSASSQRLYAQVGNQAFGRLVTAIRHAGVTDLALGGASIQPVLQRATWQDGDVTWRGIQEMPALRRQQDVFNCWATAIGIVLGISQEVIKTQVGWSKYKTKGIAEKEEPNLLKQIERRLKRRLVKVSWARIKTDRPRLPIALAIEDHYVVLNAIGLEGGVAKYIRVWDPFDAHYIEDDIASFEESQHPAYGYYKG